ncbi:MAG TPA: ATP-binding protein [Rugosimonospora sp.]|nr:ATP-binding protein [Rugosimonospora sp.]
MSTRRWLARAGAYAMVYALAAVVGRVTVLDGSTLSLVWPAAGVGVVWFCAQRRSPARWVDHLALAAATMVVNMATGAGAPAAGVFVVANLVQVDGFVRLLGRLRPQLWGAGGTATLAGTRDLWGITAAGALSAAAGAVAGSAGLWLLTGQYSWSAAVVWLARNTTSILLIGALGMRLGPVFTQARAGRQGTPGWLRRYRAGPAGAFRWRAGEYAVVSVCSVAAYLVGFGYRNGLPLAFPLIALTVWAALRLSTTFVLVHAAVMGTIAIVLTLRGDGPFAEVTDHATRALLTQLFIALITVVGLALALGRDERVALTTELAAQKQQAAQRADLMATIIDSMADGLSVIDGEGTVVLRNPATVSLLGGRTSGTVLDAARYGVFNVDGSPLAAHETPYARTKSDGHVGMDVLIRNPAVPDGRIVHVVGTALPDPHGPPGAVLLFHDVTAERRHRDELANFAGVVAHDLLNPLTSVQTWTEAAADALHDAPTHPTITATTDALTRISRAATRMHNLINDLLAYTTARDATIAPAAVNLTELVTDIATGRTDAAATTAPTPQFTIGDLPPVHADLVLIRQLLDNLISNAIKYTAPGTTPHIVITAARRTDTIEVTIADNGIGIPTGQHQAIFANFHRAHPNAGYAGTGLGLAICQRIIDRHGGTITATDNPNGGTRITFTLPAAPTHTTNPTPAHT